MDFLPLPYGAGDAGRMATIRPAEPGEEPRLQDIEMLAGQQFREVGMAAVADDDPLSVERLASYIAAGRCWVAVDNGEVFGYVLVDALDRSAHLEQISVVPKMQGRGVGRLLLAAAEDWALARGHGAITLTTFTDVPWNRPLYEHLGFRVLDEQEIGPELRKLREREAEHGLDPKIRVCMHLDL